MNNFTASLLPLSQEPIRPLEKRALNFLVNEYLLKSEYKLSAITFSDENDDQVKIITAVVRFKDRMRHVLIELTLYSISYIWLLLEST